MGGFIINNNYNFLVLLSLSLSFSFPFLLSPFLSLLLSLSFYKWNAVVTYRWRNPKLWFSEKNGPQIHCKFNTTLNSTRGKQVVFNHVCWEPIDGAIHCKTPVCMSQVTVLAMGLKTPTSWLYIYIYFTITTLKYWFYGIIWFRMVLLKNMKVSWAYYSKYSIWKVIKFHGSKPPTRVK